LRPVPPEPIWGWATSTIVTALPTSDWTPVQAGPNHWNRLGREPLLGLDVLSTAPAFRPLLLCEDWPFLIRTGVIDLQICTLTVRSAPFQSGASLPYSLANFEKSGERSVLKVVLILCAFSLYESVCHIARGQAEWLQGKAA